MIKINNATNKQKFNSKDVIINLFFLFNTLILWLIRALHAIEIDWIIIDNESVFFFSIVKEKIRKKIIIIIKRLNLWSVLKFIIKIYY